jgi:pimeloyl-ACP methyl ester carboxylesterase
MTFPILEHVVKTARHTSFFLSCGAAQATPIVFVHGWPELSISWRGQVPIFGGLGFRAIAPDMRGYGRSSVYSRHEDYGLEAIVADMLELLDALGAKKAIWVGHDWARRSSGRSPSTIRKSVTASSIFACPTSRAALRLRPSFR